MKKVLQLSLLLFTVITWYFFKSPSVTFALSCATNGTNNYCGTNNTSPSGVYPYYTTYGVRNSCISGTLQSGTGCTAGSYCALTAANTTTCTNGCSERGLTCSVSCPNGLEPSGTNGYACLSGGSCCAPATPPPATPPPATPPPATPPPSGFRCYTIGGCGGSCTPYCTTDSTSCINGGGQTSCPACPGGPVCGANGCEAGETCSSCPSDCGACPVGNAPKGFHDNSDCSVSGGWTCDPDNYNLPLDVHFYDGPGFTTFIGAVTANQTREPAVGAECGGNSNHGFTFTTPLSVKDGTTHSIYAYPISIGPDAGNNPLLGGSPRSISCPITNTVSGNVFVDTNIDKLKNAGEANYAGGITVTSTGGYSAVYSNGSFTFSGMNPGTYTISYTNVPAGYQVTYPPVNVPPPSFTVTVGGSCSVGGSNSAICTSGNISNLNFGISTNAQSWIQATGGNIRIDSGISNQIPSNADPLCGGGFMSLPGNGGQPGIIYSGASSASFGSGQASSTNWVVSSPDGQKYTPPTPNTIRTAYGYITANAGQQGLTINDLAPYCSGGIANCALSATLPTGIYKANGPLTLTGNYTFPANRNFIILVSGSLTLRGEVHVPSGSTAVFSASQDILVDSGVGEVSNTSSRANLEGIYSADRDFIVQGTNNCSVAPDRRLNISGNVISNAALAGGSFLNQRNLCAGNTCPSVSIVQRLDLIINLPPLLKAPNYIWKEVAP